MAAAATSILIPKRFVATNLNTLQHNVGLESVSKNVKENINSDCLVFFIEFKTKQELCRNIR